MSAHGWTEPDDDVDVRHVQPYQADKTYRCPGCDHEIRPGEGHKVVIRSTRRKIAGTGTPGAGSARRSGAHAAAEPQNAFVSTSTAQPPRPSGRTEATSNRSVAPP